MVNHGVQQIATFDAGFDHHVVKPVDVDRLWALIVGASPTEIAHRR